MKTPSTLIVGYGITGKNLQSTSITIAKNLCKLTLFNVKNLHVKNIMCNFVT